MNAAIAAGLGTVVEMPTTPERLTSDLRELGNRLMQAADRASTVTEYENRRRESAQIQLASSLVWFGTYSIELGLAWLSSGWTVLAQYDRADMDAVYAERVARRAL